MRYTHTLVKPMPCHGAVTFQDLEHGARRGVCDVCGPLTLFDFIHAERTEITLTDNRTPLPPPGRFIAWCRSWTWAHAFWFGAIAGATGACWGWLLAAR